MKIIYVNCASRREYESDIRNNEHCFSSSENKAWKKKHQCSALPAQQLLMTNYFCHHHYYRDRYHYLDYYLLPRATIYNSFCWSVFNVIIIIIIFMIIIMIISIITLEGIFKSIYTFVLIDDGTN